jgi:hypothetical protein
MQKKKSLWTLTLQRQKEGTMLLKMRLLRSFQIFQATHAKISIKQGPPNVDLVFWLQ